MVTGWTLVTILAVVAVASLFQAAVGFGANLIAMPVIVQLEPDLVPGSVILATMVLNTLIMVRDRDAVDLRPLSAVAVGAVAGSALGAMVVARASDRAIQVLVACCVLATVALVAAVDATPRRTPANLVTAGTASGFASVTAGIGGPPVALLFSDAEGSRVRGSLSTYFLFTATLTLTGLGLAGRLDGERLLAGVELMPAVVVGFLLGRPLIRIVDRGFIRPAILIVSGTSALVLLVRAGLGA